MAGTSIFISYSHQDEAWKDRLVKYLNIPDRQGSLEIWSDRRIVAGANWRSEIESAIARADAALLLISVDFLNSEFIQEEEVPRLLKRRLLDGLAVFPIILEDCLWKEVGWLSELQARPLDGNPLSSRRGNRLARALTEIAREIRRMTLRKPSTSEATKAKAPETRDVLLPLHQIPSPPADFTGRQEELSDLRREMERKRANVVAIRGMGGVGKTALAFYLARDLTPCYPDAQIYLDLKGVSPRPLTWAEAIAHVLQSFDPQIKLPEDEAEWLLLYRSLLHGKRVLLLMDNAGSKEQVEPLMPPEGSLLLVTSRFRFSLPGMVFRDLDELSAEDARNLLLLIASRIGDHADGISRLCGRLPIALRLAGSAISERPDLSPEAYAHRLADRRKRLELVEASLTLSYELLDRDLQTGWCALSVFQESFSANAAAAAWGKEVEQAENTLGELVKCNLLEGEAGRYHLHDLVRLFADAHLVEEERGIAQLRHSRHYLSVLQEAQDLYLKGGSGILQGLRLLDMEWRNILAGQSWAARMSVADDAAADLCSKYHRAGASVLTLRLSLKDQIAWLELALAAARRLKDEWTEGRHLGNLGAVYSWMGDEPRAIKILEERLALARKLKDRHGEAKALVNLGTAYFKLGDYPKSLTSYETALPIAREVEDRHTEAKTLGGLGTAYAELDEIGRAKELLDQWRVISRDLGNRLDEATANWNLGECYEREGDLERAVEMMQVLADFERQINHPDAEKHTSRVEEIRARARAPETPNDSRGS